MSKIEKGIESNMEKNFEKNCQKNLQNMRQFYLKYPICQTLSGKLR